MTHEFKVGDKVEIIKNMSFHKFKIGDTTTLTEYNSIGDYWRTSAGAGYDVYSLDIKLVDHEFKVGDWVEVTGGIHTRGYRDILTPHRFNNDENWFELGTTGLGVEKKDIKLVKPVPVGYVGLLKDMDLKDGDKVRHKHFPVRTVKDGRVEPRPLDCWTLKWELISRATDERPAVGTTAHPTKLDLKDGDVVKLPTLGLPRTVEDGRIQGTLLKYMYSDWTLVSRAGVEDLKWSGWKMSKVDGTIDSKFAEVEAVRLPDTEQVVYRERGTLTPKITYVQG